MIDVNHIWPLIILAAGIGGIVGYVVGHKSYRRDLIDDLAFRPLVDTREATES